MKVDQRRIYPFTEEGVEVRPVPGTEDAPAMCLIVTVAMVIFSL